MPNRIPARRILSHPACDIHLRLLRAFPVENAMGPTDTTNKSCAIRAQLQLPHPVLVKEHIRRQAPFWIISCENFSCHSAPMHIPTVSVTLHQKFEVVHRILPQIPTLAEESPTYPISWNHHIPPTPAKLTMHVFWILNPHGLNIYPRG